VEEVKRQQNKELDAYYAGNAGVANVKDGQEKVATESSAKKSPKNDVGQQEANNVETV
jgi:hypothetical protein